MKQSLSSSIFLLSFFFSVQLPWQLQLSLWPRVHGPSVQIRSVIIWLWTLAMKMIFHQRIGFQAILQDQYLLFPSFTVLTILLGQNQCILPSPLPRLKHCPHPYIYINPILLILSIYHRNWMTSQYQLSRSPSYQNDIITAKNQQNGYGIISISLRLIISGQPVQRKQWLEIVWFNARNVAGRHVTQQDGDLLPIWRLILENITQSLHLLSLNYLQIRLQYLQWLKSLNCL